MSQSASLDVLWKRYIGCPSQRLKHILENPGRSVLSIPDHNIPVPSVVK